MSFGKTYKGKYKLRKPEKYKGDPNQVVYRSSWERAAFKWCEMNSAVAEWSAEEVVIPYLDEATKRRRRYFIDLWIKWKNGKCTLIEIKPAKQLKPPKKPKRQTKRFIDESMTFVTNRCKWKAATEFAQKKGWTFQVWTENELKKIGALKW